MSTPLNKKDKEMKEIKAKGARKGRSKGGRGENEIAKIFSKWYGVPNSFGRTRTSGAQFKNKEPGDIATPKNFPMVMEIKNREEWNFSELFTDKKINHLLSYFEQANGDCKEYNKLKHKTFIKKFPIALFTKNFKPWYGMVNLNDFDFSFHINKDLSIGWEYKAVPYCIFPLEGFLRANTLTEEEKGIKYG